MEKKYAPVKWIKKSSLWCLYVGTEEYNYPTAGALSEEEKKSIEDKLGAITINERINRLKV